MRPSPGPTQPTTSPTTTLPASPSFTPSAFEFAPTIVDAGRRVASIGLINPSPVPARVTGLRVDPTGGPFGLAPGTDCVDASLASGSLCRVDVSFAPLDAGPAAAMLVASFADGSEVRVPITGVGAPVPVMIAVPDVASAGQVVTIRASGFPAGAVVDVSIGVEPASRSVTVTDSGGFDVPIVVLPNTSTGPMSVEVTGMPEMFPDVSTTLLVTTTSDRTSPGVLRGPGPSIGR